MKSKNIPVDIRAKSIKEAQNEIKDIIERFEDENIDLEASKEQYERMMQLNNYIQDKFKEKIKEIKKSNLSKKIKKTFPDFSTDIMKNQQNSSLKIGLEWLSGN